MMFDNFEKTTHFSPDILDKYLVQCAEQNVSDIFMRSDDYFAVKKDKQVMKMDGKKLNKDEISDYLAHVYMSASLSLLASGKDIDFSYSIRIGRGETIMFRANATGIIGASSGNVGIELVFRLLPPIPDINKLNFADYVKDNLVSINNEKGKSETRFSRGIFIVSGETSSGKSTLLASVIREMLLKDSIHLLGFESPIEFNLNLPNIKSIVAQSEIPTHIETYGLAMRNALRRNADVILVGECRDVETIKGAVIAAITGHIVFTTTHTNNAHSIVSRMAGELLLAEQDKYTRLFIESLQGIVHQELIPKKGGGLIALQSALFFNKEVRDRVISNLNKVEKNEPDILIKSAIVLEKEIALSGLTKQKHLELLFQDGLIEENLFESLSDKS